MWVTFNKRTLLTVSYSALVKLFRGCRLSVTLLMWASKVCQWIYALIISYFCKLIVALSL